MKTTIESKMVTTATSEDLKMVQGIIYLFDYYDGYFENMCKMKLGLNYKEYSTLKDDFKAFYEVTQIQLGRFSIKEVDSLKKSLIMLQSRTSYLGYNSNPMFLNFLEDSIINIDKWIDEVIEVICSDN